MSWAIDNSHTSLEFSVRHLGVSTVRGTFHDLDGEVELNEDDLTKSAGRVTINVASVDTRDERRDNHLRSADFFDADQFPTATFESRRIAHLGGERYQVEGDLTIRGTSRPVTLQAEVSEFITDPWGNRRAAIAVSGEINRTHWGMTFNQVLDAGRLMVGEKVKIRADAEIVVAAAIAA